MSSPALQLCPSCGTPVTPGAAFCENCGAEIVGEAAARPDASPHHGAGEGLASEGGASEGGASEGGASEGGASRSGEPETASPSARPEDSPHPLRVAAPRFSMPAEPAFDADAPFVLEWDERRAFIAGVRCNFSFRIRCRTRMARFGLCAEVDGEEPFVVRYSDLREGDVREGLFPFVPKTPGAVSVKIVAEVLYEEKGCHERFEAARPFEHLVSPLTRYLSSGNQSVNIDIRDNTGLIRLDELQLPRQAITDLKSEIDKALQLRGGWESVAMPSTSIKRERFHLRTADGECLVVAGCDTVTFGASASRTSVPLATASCQGEGGRFISGVHFVLQRDRLRNELLLRDGGPSKENPSVWRRSTNGTLVDDSLLTGSRPLHAGDALSVCLAPFVVSGGALSLSLKTRGYDEDSLGFDRTGDVSSVLVTERTSGETPPRPARSALVVWGAAQLDPIFNTHTGIRVALIRGRLHAVYPDGTARRLLFLAGRPLPGTSIFVQ